MTDLTEKWKSGELKDGWYYVLLKSRDILITSYWKDEEIDDEFFSDCNYSDIEEVLAPVPSYQELQRLESDSLVKQENTRLKELLKL